MFVSLESKAGPTFIPGQICYTGNNRKLTSVIKKVNENKFLLDHQRNMANVS